jgi:microsomal dipeptidase-like Zn-dependent dipeptidase
MNRRQFLRCSALGGLSLTFGNLFSCAKATKEPQDFRAPLKSIQIIDAHAHPDLYVFYDPRMFDNLSTLKAIKELGMVASSFAAVGDLAYISRGHLRGSDFQHTMDQLKWWINSFLKKGKIKSVLKASDVPNTIEAESPPGAILAIEGGDSLEGNPDRVNEFYQLGVRMITLVHYRNNELGDIMMGLGGQAPIPIHNGLSRIGQKVIERMEELGMVVDVAHAHPVTLKQIAAISSKPLLDSHTSLCPFEDPSRCGRLRTWKDMELIAKTGGVVCTWPFAYKLGDYVRITFLDWAKEILEMKKRLGIEHVGLGTDGGGKIPKLIKNYRDIRDLTHLIEAMQEVGLSHEEIAAYMGGNFYRVLKRCIG